MRNRARVPILILILLASFFSIKNDPVLALAYAGTGFAFYFFFPRFIKWRLARQMKVIVRERLSKVIEILSKSNWPAKMCWSKKAQQNHALH